MTRKVCMICFAHRGSVEDGRLVTVESHGCCLPCAKAKYPEAYAYMREQEAMRRGSCGIPALLKSVPRYQVAVK